MKKTKEKRQKAEIDFGKVGKNRFIVCIVIAMLAVIVKGILMVPITNEQIEGTTCEDYSTHISLPSYLAENRKTSCQNYKVNLVLYIVENIVIFVLVAGASIAIASAIPQKAKKKQ